MVSAKPIFFCAVQCIDVSGVARVCACVFVCTCACVCLVYGCDQWIIIMFGYMFHALRFFACHFYTTLKKTVLDTLRQAQIRLVIPFHFFFWCHCCLLSLSLCLFGTLWPLYKLFDVRFQMLIIQFTHFHSNVRAPRNAKEKKPIRPGIELHWTG